MKELAIWDSLITFKVMRKFNLNSTFLNWNGFSLEYSVDVRERIHIFYRNE